MITLFYAGALTFLGLVLASRVIQLRLSNGILQGTGDNSQLHQAARAQGNLVEYAPFFLILLGCMEMAGVSVLALYVFGDLFLLARISHAIGLSKGDGTSILRTIGAVSTLLIMIVQSIWAIYLGSAWMMANNWGL
ncbi:MAG: MAPEG family protein [Gammaproteobacteria bacterium]